MLLSSYNMLLSDHNTVICCVRKVICCAKLDNVWTVMYFPDGSPVWTINHSGWERSTICWSQAACSIVSSCSPEKAHPCETKVCKPLAACSLALVRVCDQFPTIYGWLSCLGDNNLEIWCPPAGRCHVMGSWWLRRGSRRHLQSSLVQAWGLFIQRSETHLKNAEARQWYPTVMPRAASTCGLHLCMSGRQQDAPMRSAN